MTHAEVIAMRDQLSAEIEESKLTEPVEIADMLIGAGWVTRERHMGDNKRGGTQ